MIGSFTQDALTLLFPTTSFVGRKVGEEIRTGASPTAGVLAPDPTFWLLLVGAGAGAYFLLRKKRRGRR